MSLAFDGKEIAELSKITGLLPKEIKQVNAYDLNTPVEGWIIINDPVHSKNLPPNNEKQWCAVFGVTAENGDAFEIAFPYANDISVFIRFYNIAGWHEWKQIQTK